MSLDRRKFIQSSTGCVAAALSSGVANLNGANDLFGNQTGQGKKKKQIKVAQIGVGHAHASKLSAYRISDDYEVVGISEPNEALRKRAEASAPYRDLAWLPQEKVLNMKDLDVVLVETRVRDSAFRNLIRQEVAFFDLHPVGTITSQLADDAAMIHSFSGQPIRLFVMNLASVVVGIIGKEERLLETTRFRL